jgi:2-phosphosulfolactate phosphatase
MKIDAVFGPAEFPGLSRRDLAGTASVVFDILRATTTMIAALENGARAVRPALEIGEALEWRAREPEVLLAGERGGLRILAAQTGSIDFDLGNSPREFTRERVEGRTIVMTTTNGTRALAACAHSQRVFPAAFSNLEATMDLFAKINPERLLLICAGTFDDPAYEDILAAGAACEDLFVRGIEVELGDAAAVAWQSYQSIRGDLFGAMRFSKNARKLLAQPDLEGDVPVCLLQNVSRMVAEMKSGLVKPATDV